MGAHKGLRQNESALRKKIILKRRARKELQSEIEALKSLLYLQRLESKLIEQQSRDFNPVLALQIDAVGFLVNSMGERRNPPQQGRKDKGMKEAR